VTTTQRSFAALVLAAVTSVTAIEAQTGSSTQSPSSSSVGAGQTAVPAGNAERGRELYRKIGCYQCHSGQAQGGVTGPRLGPRPMPYPGFVQYLRAPTGEMPPYTAKVMTDQEVADVYAFLQSLPPPPVLANLPLLQR
jgi:mono/diheme cytochrome c family protein